MSKPPPDYDAIERDLWRENVEKVCKELSTNQDHIIKKIQTFADRFGFQKSDIREKIQTDEMFAAHFAKEPWRQGFHEKIAAKWIEELETVKTFEILKKSGRNAHYVTNHGQILSGITSKGQSLYPLLQGDVEIAYTTKSLDFKWQTGEITFYASHKYTKKDGGNQTSQFNEMKALLDHFSPGVVTQTVLIVIVDGLYYTPNRLNDLREFTRDTEPCSYAIPIRELPTILKKYS